MLNLAFSHRRLHEYFGTVEGNTKNSPFIALLLWFQSPRFYQSEKKRMLNVASSHRRLHQHYEMARIETLILSRTTAFYDLNLRVPTILSTRVARHLLPQGTIVGHLSKSSSVGPKR